VNRPTTLVFWFRLIAFLILLIALTALTQVGGVLLLVAWVLCRGAFPRTAKVLRAVCISAVFAALYMVATFLLIPPMAAMGGRVALSCSDAEPLGSASRLFCLLNRNYVTPRTKAVAEALAADIAQAHPGTLTRTLDGSFPFFDGFPLPPHLSHNDGRKLDIAYFYRLPNGEYVRGVTRSPVGYFAFEQPPPHATLPCAGRGDRLTLRWDLGWLQAWFPRLILDEGRTAYALRWLVETGPSLGVSRVFVEPQVAERLGVHANVLRFQGCRAARHDDHIHIEVEP
jgi:hypothetical protein